MVSLQFWRKKADEPISKVLKELQSQINNHELKVSSLRQKQRSITGQITLYSVLIYLAYLVYYALGRNYELEGQPVLIWTSKIVVMLLFPVTVFGLRRTVRWWYTRLIDREIQEKETLKTRLDQKIEELKEKSDYYNTQQLLERYDTKAQSKNTTPQKPEHQLQHKPSTNDLRQRASIEGLRQRQLPPGMSPGIPQPGVPQPGIPQPGIRSSVTPPGIPISLSTSSGLSSLSSSTPRPSPIENIPQFHPSAFSPPPSPILPVQPQSKTFLDKILDLLAGEDENAPQNRYALICRHCKTHNGLAPPGERPESIGYLCGRCGGWNGPDPMEKTKQKEKAVREEKLITEEKKEEESGNGETGNEDMKKEEEIAEKTLE